MNPARMASAIRAGAWTGILNTKPYIIENVFRHYHCEACELAKRNEAVRQTGHQIPIQTMGSHISVDYIPVHCTENSKEPKAFGDYVGYFLFRCKATGFMAAYLTKTKSTLVSHFQI